MGLPRCGRCGRECPVNEFVSYGGHEDCDVEGSVFMPKHLDDPVEGVPVRGGGHREGTRKPMIRIISTSYGRSVKNRGKYDTGNFG